MLQVAIHQHHDVARRRAQTRRHRRLLAEVAREADRTQRGIDSAQGGDLGKSHVPAAVVDEDDLVAGEGQGLEDRRQPRVQFAERAALVIPRDHHRQPWQRRRREGGPRRGRRNSGGIGMRIAQIGAGHGFTFEKISGRGDNGE